MRVIAGRARGLTLRAPKGTRVRPTSDRVKESLFAMLAGRVEGARVLDLFAGSGALGIEALSRGAASATFVDRSRASLAVIRENLQRARFLDEAELIAGDAAAVAACLAAAGRQFDLIFADPPYGKDLLGPVFRTIEDTSLLAPDGWFIVEHSSREEIVPPGEKLGSVRRRRYGDTVISIYAFTGSQGGGERCE